MKVPHLSLRAGSVAFRVLEHLHASAPGTRLTRDEIAEQFSAVVGNVSTLLSKAVEAGALEIASEGKTRYYFLPADAPDEEAEVVEPLGITSDSDGDIWFTGARIDSAGVVLLSAEQLQQLVAYATTAPVLRPSEGQYP